MTASDFVRVQGPEVSQAGSPVQVQGVERSPGHSHNTVRTGISLHCPGAGAGGALKGATGGPKFANLAQARRLFEGRPRWSRPGWGRPWVEGQSLTPSSQESNLILKQRREGSRVLSSIGRQLKSFGPSHWKLRSLRVWIFALVPLREGILAISPLLGPTRGSMVTPQSGTSYFRSFQTYIIL